LARWTPSTSLTPSRNSRHASQIVAKTLPKPGPWPIKFANFPRNLAPDFTHYLSERPDKATNQKGIMEAKPERKKRTKKEPKLKVRDLKPTKDAKGGWKHIYGP